MISLPTVSQYKVLRFTAHMMDREVVRLGATRMASAIAGSTAQAKVNAIGFRDAKVPQLVKRKEKKGMSPAFLATPEAKRLLGARDALKAQLSNPPTVDQLSGIRQVSAALRAAWCSFRDTHEGNTTA
jgi:hypothetical protein